MWRCRNEEGDQQFGLSDWLASHHAALVLIPFIRSLLYLPSKPKLPCHMLPVLSSICLKTQTTAIIVGHRHPSPLLLLQFVFYKISLLQVNCFFQSTSQMAKLCRKEKIWRVGATVTLLQKDKAHLTSLNKMAVL